MNNSKFYSFCRDQRKHEKDECKHQVLIDVYNFMRECGVSRNGVNKYIDARLRQETPTLTQEAKQAYTWLRGVFDGNINVQEQAQNTLL